MSAHDWYVAAAYAAAAIGLAGLIGGILLDQHSLRRQMAELEAAGLRRRSDKGGKA